jgi:hypothetical protein
MIFSVTAVLTAVAFSPTLRAAHRAVSLHHIEVRILSPAQIRFELRCASWSPLAATSQSSIGAGLLIAGVVLIRL